MSANAAHSTHDIPERTVRAAPRGRAQAADFGKYPGAPDPAGASIGWVLFAPITLGLTAVVVAVLSSMAR